MINNNLVLFLYLEQLSISSNAIRKCWQDILYERTLQKAGVVLPRHFSSLMRPFSFDQPEQGQVVLQWLELVAGNEWTEQGRHYRIYTDVLS